MNLRLDLLNSIEYSVGISSGIILNVWEHLEGIDFFHPVASFCPEDSVIIYLLVSFLSLSVRSWCHSP